MIGPLVNNNKTADFPNLRKEDMKLNLLKPDQDKHQFFLDIQPRLGKTLRVQARTQINVQLYDFTDIEDLKENQAVKLRPFIFPFLWTSDGNFKKCIYIYISANR